MSSLLDTLFCLNDCKPKQAGEMILTSLVIVLLDLQIKREKKQMIT